MHKKIWMIASACLLSLHGFSDVIALEHLSTSGETTIRGNGEDQPTLFEALEMLIQKASEKKEVKAEANDLVFEEDELSSPLNWDNNAHNEDE